MSTSACFFEKGFGQRLKELESSDRHELLRRLWPSTEAEPSQSDEIASPAFLQFIAAELERVRHHQQLFAVQDFDGILAVIDIIRTHAAKPCRELLSILSLQYIYVALDSVRRSMELAIRLWLTLNVHTVDIRVGPETTEEDPIDWNLDLSLEELLRNQFPKRTINNDRENPLRFDTRLTAAYLVNICGMKLQLSDDIASHLNFDLNRLVLTIYRHKVCLKSHLLSSEKSPISKELLQEILRTMDLLFPFGDDATRNLLFREGQQSLYTLGTYRGEEDLDWANYRYFGVKLELLMKSFDQTSRTWRQLAFDRRNKLEWSAFWVTVMVALLTVISIPCTIIQAVYSVKAYQLALAQNDINQRTEL